MENIQNYINLLEKLEERVSGEESYSNYFNKSISQIEVSLSLTFAEISNNLTLRLPSCILTSDCPSSWRYTCYLYYILLTITDYVADSAKNEIVDNDKLLFFIIKTLKITSFYGLVPYLHDAFLKNPCFNSYYNKEPKSVNVTKTRLMGSVNSIAELFKLKEIVRNDTVDLIFLQYTAGIYSLLYLYENDVILSTDLVSQESQHYQQLLNALHIIVQNKYFKHILILKSIKDLPVKIQNSLHTDLMERLIAPNGYEMLCKNVIPQENNSNAPIWRRAEVIYNIVGHKGHKKSFYPSIIDEILNFLNVCVSIERERQYIPICIGSLNKIYNLPYAGIREKVETHFVGPFERMCNPPDMLAGSIIFDDVQLKILLFKNFMAFCGPFSVILRSKILIKYLPVLFNLHSQMPDSCLLQNQITSLIIQCLGNRERDELNSIIDMLLYDASSNGMQQLHHRVIVKYNESSAKYSIQINSDSNKHYYDSSQTFVNVLKKSKHNILIYNIFLHLFESLEYFMESPATQTNAELLNDLSELNIAMTKAFKKRIAIICTLTELINYKPFHSQFNENPREILDLIKNILGKSINRFKKQSDKKPKDESIMSVILSIVIELIKKLNTNENFGEFLKTIKEYRTYSVDTTIQKQIDSIIELMDASSSGASVLPNASKYDMAKTLCQESEPHLRVYGIMTFIQLLKNDRDEHAIANKHSILAIALSLLKDEDSYSFLNCIKLLVTLIDVLENDVIESLIAEFQVEESDIDYRLKIGETIVKVTEGLGPMSYKYKDTLIHCFLRGCTNKNDDLRTSSLSSLGSICRLLSYQIHNFFQELMVLIESIIINDKHTPARRGAVLVLAHILCGIENLIDFQEILLPIYRLLKYVITNEGDESTLIHANIGLEHLQKKVKSFLQPKQEVEKEIQIFGIKDTERMKAKDKNAGILEIL